jgi:trimeric autotransporter adhesin
MNGVTYQPTLNITGNDRKTGTLTLPVDFVEGTHSLEIEGGADYAGFKVAKVTKQFTFTKDTAAITATVKESTETSVTLKFNKPISDLSTNAVAQYLVFSHSYKGQNAVTNNGAGFIGGSITKVADDEYTINFNQPLPPGSTTVYFDYAANTADSNKVKDGYGNILQPFSFTVNTAADTVKPQVSSVEFVDANKVKVVFSEKVDNTTGANGARNTANYVLKDAQGNIVAINSITNVNSDLQTFELSTDTINGGSYTLEVKNIKDRSVAQNTLDTVTKGFTAADKVAPTVNATVEVLGQKKIRIKFSEAMDKASIENKDNYNVDSNVVITAAADNKSVILDYTNVTPAVDFTAGPATTTILVGQVKDAAGNKTANFSTTVTVTHGTPTVNAEKVEVIARDKVKLTIPGVITNVAATDFAVKVTSGSTPSATGGWAAANVLSSAEIGGKTEIVLQLPTPVAATDTELPTGSSKAVAVATGTVAAGTLTPASATGAQNEFGAKVNIPMTLAADKVGPEVLTRTTADADGDGYIDSLAITFSEDLFAGSVTADDFVVDGYTIEGVKSVVGDTVTLSLKERNVYDTAATPNVKVVGTVEDVLRNASTAETAATAATDGAAPVLLSATTASANTITLTYSEAATITTPATGRFSLDLDGAGATPAAAEAAAPSISNGKVVLTFTGAFLTGVTDSDATITYTPAGAGNAANVKDAAGNEAVAKTLTGFTSGF